MCNQTGWTWDYVENHMTMSRLSAMEKEWEKRPSQVSTLTYISSYFGMEIKRKITPPAQQNANVGAALELARHLQSMG